MTIPPESSGRSEAPILEYDPDPDAVIAPGSFSDPQETGPVPEHCVLCFFHEVLAKVVEARQPRVIKKLYSEMGLHPVYELTVEDGRRVAFLHPGVGAPLAVALLDEVIALGCRKFVACGGAGVLAPEIAVGHLVVPTAAVRDEGTSYHYLPPGREVAPDPGAAAAIEAALAARGVPYVTGKTWTTDAIYRETRGRAARRAAEGCLTVEMEAASFFACAQFRGVMFGQVLYGGDDLSGEAWDHRHWTRHEVREMLFWLAIDACLRIPDRPPLSP